MKKSFQAFLEKENQPMRQATYWIIYIACAYVFTIKTVEASIMASYGLIEINPQVAQYSNFVNFFFF